MSDGNAAALSALVMPGPVVQGHAKFETECGQCHEPLTKTVKSRLCLDCHKDDIASDAAAKSGFHGRIPNMDQRDCRSCHSEHKGRKADIVGLDRATFIHNASTDFQLQGSHATADCKGCHKPGVKFRDAPQQCNACHKKDDYHRGEMGEQCSDCHEPSRWKKTRFDHDLKTDFRLLGKHKEVTCQGCHPDQHYKETPSSCYGCHQLSDVHKAQLGQKCETCHQPTQWKQEKFDHDRDTAFKLTGRHEQVRCESCHKLSPYTETLRTACVHCHREDDPHKGQFGHQCESCHSTSGWSKPTFDHNRDTTFPLRHQHAKLQCPLCHQDGLFEVKLEKQCVACHRKDDVHRKQEGEQCERCHNEKGWREKVAFSHELTRFPLIGQHAIVPCAECHLTPSFQDSETACVSCHQPDDPHQQGLGNTCASCHTPQGWKLWRFDHTKQTQFPLEGRHQQITCIACHKTPTEKEIKLAHECFDCHQKDDAHGGAFGQACQRCHSPDSFRELKARVR